MDQATLVIPDLDTGREVLRVLDAADIKPVVALLMVSPEYGDWRLVLSSPSLDQSHLLKAYEKVMGALQGRFVYRLPPMLVLPTKDPFIRDLRKIFGKTKEVAGMRLGGQRFGDRFISDAYVYRIQ